MRTSMVVQDIALRDDGSCAIRTEGVELRLMMMGEDVLRIRAGFDEDFRERSYVLTTTAWEDEFDAVLGAERTRIDPTPLRLEEDPDSGTALLLGPRLRVEIARCPFALTVRDHDGQVLHRDVPVIAYREDRNGRRIHTMVNEPEDSFYGLGETTGPLDKRHSRYWLSPRDSLGYDAERTDPLYKHIPFWLKVNRARKAAVGYFLHNTHEMSVDFGRSHSNYFPHHSQVSVDGGDIDLFLIAGPSIRQIITRYTDLTGRPPVLPRQALGYLASSMYYAELEKDCDQAIISLLEIAKAEGIPVDGFQLSSGYTTQDTPLGPKRCVFTWNQERFPDPEAFFEGMRKRQVVVSPNVKPGILEVHPRLAEFAAQNVFVQAGDDAIAQAEATAALYTVRGQGSGATDASTTDVTPEHPEGDGSIPVPARGAWWGGPGRFIDFTSPHAREAWKSWLTEAVLSKGTSSVWNDNCEYDGIIDLDSRVEADGAGGTIGSLRTVMANLMCAVTWEAITEHDPQTRPFIVCRAGHAGIQRFAQTWAGDNSTSWQTLCANTATILGMSLSGVANQGCDIGGFHGPRPDPELLVRWVQHGIFQPRFSIHSVNSDSTVTEPWMYPEVTPLIREAILLRYRLVPYLYSLMVRASREGSMIIEPLVSAFQDDVEGYDTSDVFMLGDSLLVAGVLEPGARTRTVRFPAGETFYCLESRTRYEGGSTAVLDVDLSSIPLFLRGGGIIPIAVNQPMSLARDDVHTLRILCAPDRDGEFTLHEDDGITRAHENGERRETIIRMRAGTTVHLDLERHGPYRSALRTILVDLIHPDRAPLTVLCNGREITHYLHRPAFDHAAEGWHYDASSGSALIRLNDDGTDIHLEISFDPFDMIGM